MTLVAADERIGSFRHPIPTRKTVEHYAMIVTCAAYKGLISCCTRFVCFRPMTELEDRMQSLAHIDAAVNLSTKPGRTLGELFFILQRGVRRPGLRRRVEAAPPGRPHGLHEPRGDRRFPAPTSRSATNQAFAWNPSIPGAKSEDTTFAKRTGSKC